MFHDRTNNNKINKFYEKCLRLIYSDRKSPFQELLVKDNSVSIQHQNLGALAVEMYKVYTVT